MNVKSFALVVGGIVLVAIITIKLGNWSTSESSTGMPASGQPLLVEVAPVTVGSITESIQAVGTLEAIASITVRPEIAGVIRRINFQGH